MKPFTSATLTSLGTGRAIERELMLLDLVSGLYGFWTGTSIFTFGGVDYVGAGQLIRLEASSDVMDLSSVSLVARLSAIPDTALTPNVLATIENEIYHQRPVTISRAYFHPDTVALLSVERWFRGYVDKIDHEEDIGGQFQLVAYLESKSRDHLKTGHRLRADSDQRRLNAQDGGLRYAATAAQTQIFWGRQPPGAVTRGSAGSRVTQSGLSQGNRPA
jgi:hypothetical protein